MTAADVSYPPLATDAKADPSSKQYESQLKDLKDDTRDLQGKESATVQYYSGRMDAVGFNSNQPHHVDVCVGMERWERECCIFHAGTGYRRMQVGSHTLAKCTCIS